MQFLSILSALSVAEGSKCPAPEQKKTKSSEAKGATEASASGSGHTSQKRTTKSEEGKAGIAKPPAVEPIVQRRNNHISRAIKALNEETPQAVIARKLGLTEESIRSFVGSMTQTDFDAERARSRPILASTGIFDDVSRWLRYSFAQVRFRTVFLNFTFAQFCFAHFLPLHNLATAPLEIRIIAYLIASPTPLDHSR